VHVAIRHGGLLGSVPRKARSHPGEADASALGVSDILGGGELHFGGLPDMKLDTVPLVEVNRFLEEVVTRVDPDIVFTHHAHDLNRDHRVVHEASHDRLPTGMRDAPCARF